MGKTHLEDNDDYDLVNSIIEKELSAINLNRQAKFGENSSSKMKAKTFSSKESYFGSKDVYLANSADQEEYDQHHDNYFEREEDLSSSSNSKNCSSKSINAKQTNIKQTISHSCKISFPMSLHEHLDEEQASMLMKSKSLSNFLNAIDVLVSKPLSSTIYYQYIANNILTISSTAEGLDYFTKKLKVTPYTIIKCMLNEVSN